MTNLITIKSIQDLLVSRSSNLVVDDNTSRRIWWCALELIQKELRDIYYKKNSSIEQIHCSKQQGKLILSFTKNKILN